jgi:hypothetical protein
MAIPSRRRRQCVAPSPGGVLANRQKKNPPARIASAHNGSVHSASATRCSTNSRSNIDPPRG